jgi:alpha-L-fucosidase
MRTYSGSIYEATASTYSVEPLWGFYTKKPGKLFAHVLHWPTTGTLLIPTLQNAVHRIYLMDDPRSSLGYSVSEGNINISIPPKAPNTTDSVIVVEVAGVPAV